jgi:ribosome-binding protein aMBF1 (putative translation factor)
MFTQKAIERVRKFRQRKGWTINKLATRAGVTESTIRMMDEPTWNPEAKTLKKLEGVIAEERAAAQQGAA